MFLESTHTYRSNHLHFLTIKNDFNGSVLSVTVHKADANSDKEGLLAPLIWESCKVMVPQWSDKRPRSLLYNHNTEEGLIV